MEAGQELLKHAREHRAPECAAYWCHTQDRVISPRLRRTKKGHRPGTHFSSRFSQVTCTGATTVLILVTLSDKRYASASNAGHDDPLSLADTRTPGQQTPRCSVFPIPPDTIAQRGPGVSATRAAGAGGRDGGFG